MKQQNSTPLTWILAWVFALTGLIGSILFLLQSSLVVPYWNTTSSLLFSGFLGVMGALQLAFVRIWKEEVKDETAE